MSLGRFIRGLFGPYERQITAAYRSIYVDIDAYVDGIRKWVPSARNILEVGCGEGAVTERLAAAYPSAEITAIDISPRLGRLYRGPAGRVRFLERTVQEVAAAEPGRYDLAMLADVLHHVPVPLRGELLDSVRAALAPGGAFVFKDWERSATPIHWLCHASDRWLTGDKVAYMKRGEAKAALARSFGNGSIAAEAWVRPWRNNFMMLVRP